VYTGKKVCLIAGKINSRASIVLAPAIISQSKRDLGIFNATGTGSQFIYLPGQLSPEPLWHCLNFSEPSLCIVISNIDPQTGEMNPVAILAKQL